MKNRKFCILSRLYKNNAKLKYPDTAHKEKTTNHYILDLILYQTEHNRMENLGD